MPQPSEASAHSERRCLSDQILGKAILKAGEQILTQSLAELEENITRKAIGNEHVARAERCSLCLDVAYEIYRRLAAKQLICVDHHCAALALLGTVVEQSDLRRLYAEHILHIYRAHDRELTQVLWLNVDIRAGVDKQHRTRKRQHRGYRRALYTSYSANDERGAGMQRAGISRADESIALSVAQHPESDSHRRVALFANDAQRLILHSYNAVGMNDTYTVKLGLSARSACGIAYLVLASDDDIAVLRHCRSRVEHTDNARLRRIVSAHYVDYYLHPLSLRRALTLRSLRPLLRLRRHASARARAYSRSPRCSRRQYSCPCS